MVSQPEKVGFYSSSIAQPSTLSSSGLMISPTPEVLYTAFMLRQLVRTVTVIHASQTTQYITDKPLQLIAKIRERHMKAGVAISPDTASTAITDEVGSAADMLLVMTVYPGSFNPASLLSVL